MKKLTGLLIIVGIFVMTVGCGMPQDFENLSIVQKTLHLKYIPKLNPEVHLQPPTLKFLPQVSSTSKETSIATTSFRLKTTYDCLTKTGKIQCRFDQSCHMGKCINNCAELKHKVIQKGSVGKCFEGWWGHHIRHEWVCPRGYAPNYFKYLKLPGYYDTIGCVPVQKPCKTKCIPYRQSCNYQTGKCEYRASFGDVAARDPKQSKIRQCLDKNGKVIKTCPLGQLCSTDGTNTCVASHRVCIRFQTSTTCASDEVCWLRTCIKIAKPCDGICGNNGKCTDLTGEPQCFCKRGYKNTYRHICIPSN